MTIIRIGLDTSKHVFQLHGVDEKEVPVLRRQLRRGEMTKFFAKLPPTRIGIEACGASHHWARVLRGLGHEVLLLPPQYVKPYVKRGKNDAADAAAICEAMSRPGMRFVPVKSTADQAALMLLRVRDLLVKQRTMLINAIRGHAAEFGVVGAKGSEKVAVLLERVSENGGLPAPAREMFELLAGQLATLEARIATLDKQLMARHREDPRSQLLATIPGIGPIGGVSFALKVPDAAMFRSGRHFCRLARHHPAPILDRGPTAPRQNQPGGRREPAPTVGARRHRRHPPGQTRPRLAPLALLQSADAQAKEAGGGGAGQQDGPHHLGHAGERRTRSRAAGGLKPLTAVNRSGACKDSSKMAIGQSEDRDNPWNPAMLRHHGPVWDPIRVTHLGQRSLRPRIKACPRESGGPDI